MRLLDRYLLRELLFPLGYCLGGFLLFWVAFDLFAELGQFERKGLSALEIAHYYLLVIPEFLVLVMPIALLLALLYSLTNHARHNEITAIRAAGVSLWRLSLPYLAVGFLMSLAAFAVNELWAPGSSEAAEDIRTGQKLAGDPAARKVRHLGFTNAREGRHWLIGLYDPETGEMIKPKVFWSEPDGSRLRLEADRGVYTNETWTFFDAVKYIEAAGTNSLPMPVLQTNVLAMPDFSETPELVRSEIKVSKSMGLTQSKRADLAISEILNYLRLHPRPPRADAWWLETKLQGRLAAPWTCLIVVLIALPFGAASGRRNVFVGVASSIVIAFSYFVLQQVSLALGTGGYLPAWLAAWLPNLCFGVTGLWLSARVR